MPKDSEIVEILKMITSFNDEDFDSKESKDKLSSLFHQLIMSNDPLSEDFLGRFIDEVSNILDDMKIIASEQEPEEEPAPEEDVPVDAEGGEEEVPTPEEETPVDAEGGDTDIPSELLGAGYQYEYIRPIIESANRYIYQ